MRRLVVGIESKTRLAILKETGIRVRNCRISCPSNLDTTCALREGSRQANVRTDRKNSAPLAYRPRRTVHQAEIEIVPC